jgi:hypothetical protein
MRQSGDEGCSKNRNPTLPENELRSSSIYSVSLQAELYLPYLYSSAEIWQGMHMQKIEQKWIKSSVAEHGGRRPFRGLGMDRKY